MKYHVTVADRTYQVELDGDQVRVDGATVGASVTTIPGTPVRHLVLDGRSVTLAAQPLEPGRWAFVSGGEVVEAEVIDERTRHIRSLGAGRTQAAGGTVKAPMPGLVVRVLARSAGLLDRLPELTAVPSSGIPQAAERPLYSVLDTSAIRRDFGIEPPALGPSLRACIEEMKKA